MHSKRIRMHNKIPDALDYSQARNIQLTCIGYEISSSDARRMSSDVSQKLVLTT